MKKFSLGISVFALSLCGALLISPVLAKGNLVYVSWGDRIMLSDDVFQLDAPARIDAAFDHWRFAFGARAILWRISDEVIRDEYECRVTGPFYKNYYAKVKEVGDRYGSPVRLAREAARKNGLEFFLYETFLDHGCPTNILYGDTVPFPWQDRATRDHPEWEEVDLRGNRHFGVIDLSIAAARRLAVDRFVRYVKKYDPDGIYVCDRSHSHPAEHADQFGFGPEVVAEYARRHGIDITKDARFDWQNPAFAPKSPEVEAWRRLRGEYLVQFYRELRAALPSRLVYLALPRGSYLGAPYGNLYVDVERIVREKLADGIVLNVYSGRGLYPHDKRPHAARGYLSSCDDGFNVPVRRDAIAALLPLCRANGVKLFYAGNMLEEPAADGAMLVETFPRETMLRLYDDEGLLAGGALSLKGSFRLGGKFAKCVSAPRLVNKYAHEDGRGWELFVDKGRLVFRLHLEQPGGGRRDFLLASDREFPLEKWVEVAAAFDGGAGEATLALDGVPAGTLKVPVGARLVENREIPVVFGSYAHGGQYADLCVGPLTLSGGGGRTVARFHWEDAENPVAEMAPGVRLQIRGRKGLRCLDKPGGGRALDLTISKE